MRQPILFPAWIKAEIIPGLPFRWYGLTYLLAFAIVYLLFRLQLRQGNAGSDKEKIRGFFFSCIVGLLLGARLFAAMIGDTSHAYWTEPWHVFWPFDKAGRFTGLAGMDYFGGAMGLIFAAWSYARSKKIDFPEWGDMIAAATPLAYAIGRLGNFMNGELYGRVTTSQLGMVFPGAGTFSAKEVWVQDIAAKTGISINSMNDMLNLPRHPTQLYEALFEGILLWLILWFVAKRFKPFKGFVIAAYLTGYGIVHFAIGYFRMPDADRGFVISLGDAAQPYYLSGSWLNITMGQALSFAMIIAGMSLYLALRARKTGVNAPPRKSR